MGHPLHHLGLALCRTQAGSDHMAPLRLALATPGPSQARPDHSLFPQKQPERQEWARALA